ncbi:MAG: hypothetical protein ACQEWU_07990 [Bacillota bacterium]|uniref:YesK-like protein n=1 Tax=Virgibacillus salarius TaxID=447199 RepID=A0A941IAH7_9BACI|nr:MULTISPECIES: hypothetical protein [Bacillaceae]NAZ10653.1 hypothetical protein [Agaribacter marinus]MBR7797944.1 hypothetical protein [Virgibacillus salarius]MCC2250019.1 hypothetical protein [Virgibacillus sp. AGTR]MDY7044645.1 hypothetical protein [Virgibacillus sp. M23]QRZ18128.1 hypothetical protein JUJ52_20865 [Virgibacillus sp. AGTR]
MVQSVLTIGAILAVILVAISLVLLKATSKKSYTGYIPGFLLVIVGIVFLVLATLVEKVDIMGAGFGGWGIAALFASAIGLIITALTDSYANAKA